MVSRLRRPKALVTTLLDWFAREARDLPWRRTLDPYAIWVSEIMLQQTQVKTVIPYWERWMRELPDIASLASASPERIHKLWEGLGYYTRVRNLQVAAQHLVRDRAGEFPRTFNAVLTLKGIGRYTAGAITSIAFNQHSPILDGNVIRVLTRLHGIEENPRDKETNAKLWQLAEELVHAAAAHEPRITLHSSLLLSGPCSALNQSLMELGALVCTPKQPRCDDCPLRKPCVARATNRVEALPNLGKRATVTERRFAAFLVQQREKWLVQQRPDGVVNAHLWEFPNTEVELDATNLIPFIAKLLPGKPTQITRLTTIKHSITRYRISLEAYLVTMAKMPPRPAKAPSRWLGIEELDELAFTSAHRKVLAALVRMNSG